MFNQEAIERLLHFATLLPIFFLSIAAHEYAHARAAYHYGDDTAERRGRLTLNPFKHLDLVGSVLMPLMAFFSGFALIGWAKPVPVNPANFGDPRGDDAVVTFFGPGANLALAFAFLAVFALVFHGAFLPLDVGNVVIQIAWYGVYLNVFLFLFNLLPVPPLDGSHLLYALFPTETMRRYMRLGAYGTFILLVFIYSPLWEYFSSVVEFVLDNLLKLAGAS
jgi:Zn-dependent protease